MYLVGIGVPNRWLTAHATLANLLRARQQSEHAIPAAVAAPRGGLASLTTETQTLTQRAESEVPVAREEASRASACDTTALDVLARRPGGQGRPLRAG